MNKLEVVTAVAVLGTIVTLMATMTMWEPHLKTCKNIEQFHYNTQVIETSDFYSVCDLFVIGSNEAYCELNVSIDCPNSPVFSQWINVSQLKKVR